jgi:HSP20 family protein
VIVVPRKDIFDWIREEIDSFFEEIERPSWNLERKCLEPLVYVRDEDDEVVVDVDLPCVRKKEDIEVISTEKMLEIKAKMERAVKFGRWGTVQKDVNFDAFHRIIRLPSEVIPEEVRAKFDRGLLEVRLPKKHRKTRIEIE